ncbi:hypothetical protein LTR91_017675 [Friedmanniomyces endolithicus]|uniref:Secreted protein n=1 Tax=Friedmanniomyces endolithicus TaxID=329885 RepID=A0AAN6K5R8_9PEZI|nr:hypothetical protein LTR57_022006 [Friedmanniomyces endolithicus]KAK0966167.1 hypothetical protein LTR91_017675 [Friedmanniomyces endolithicus]KAK1012383.1 hypothetical protein LTS01_001161 [Friedmanniomyces endolithicus]KAK1045613.1 hypothetical protein LTS16_006328 [Friedmanniomyces endolithicus]KAK1082237.1 hypothetical protein LTR33_004062 [Friedmanniomyces endolithicus]
MELNTFALVIAIAGTIMAFPTNPLEDVEPASDPPHHSIPFHVATILASLTEWFQRLLAAANAPVTHRHRDDRPATRNPKVSGGPRCPPTRYFPPGKARKCPQPRVVGQSQVRRKKARVTSENWSPMPGR